jgi:hypothetical protein
MSSDVTDHQPPADLIKFLAPEDVGQPLLRVLGMLSAVILDDRPELFVCEVITAPPAPVPATNDQIDTGFRKARKHKEQTEPSFLRRVDTFPREGCRSPR